MKPDARNWSSCWKKADFTAPCPNGIHLTPAVCPAQGSRRERQTTRQFVRRDYRPCAVGNPAQMASPPGWQEMGFLLPTKSQTGNRHSVSVENKVWCCDPVARIRAEVVIASSSLLLIRASVQTIIVSPIQSGCRAGSVGLFHRVTRIQEGECRGRTALHHEEPPLCVLTPKFNATGKVWPRQTPEHRTANFRCPTSNMERVVNFLMAEKLHHAKSGC